MGETLRKVRNVEGGKELVEGEKLTLVGAPGISDVAEGQGS